MATSTPVREWRKEVKGVEYLISTSIDLLDLDMINNAFESEEMYWAKRLDIDTLKLMLQHSTTLGVYEVPPAIPEPATVSEPSTPRTPSPSIVGPSPAAPKQIGLARFITDHVSTCYLTDVYISPSHRGLDLGKWLVASCGEVIDSMPALRRAFLVATPGKGMAFYGKELGFWDASEESGKIAVMTRRGFAL
ncbi:hypothetical protein B0A48_06224 [Cryoendolithus antarcticus]|uniref:N-acetyltransferase domain-containing protein n=1 Tax=Cryoendolithus antarcticus TaxID=1507870 RepID=A0A1V8TAQ2_9PEZI|nr:hypothetical protein B0A48_06224 [Cryoendolithus antarcticus]